MEVCNADTKRRRPTLVSSSKHDGRPKERETIDTITSTTSSNREKVIVTSKYLDIPDYAITVVGHEKAPDAVIEVVATNTKIVKKRFKEIWEFHDQVVVPMDCGIEGPPRHVLSFTQDASFIEKRSRELDIYFLKLLKFTSIILHTKFIHFFEIHTLESAQMLRNREMKEVKKVLIQNEKANRVSSTSTPNKTLPRQRKTTDAGTESTARLRTKSESSKVYQQSGHLNVPGWGL